MNNPAKLLDRVRERIRARHYSIRTENPYVDWARRFILFHGKRHPKEMGVSEVEVFLTHLAVERNVAASTQGQAKVVLLFLYREVLNIDMPRLKEMVEAKAAKRLPVVLTPREVSARFICPMPWSASIRMPINHGVGSMFFLRRCAR